MSHVRRLPSGKWQGTVRLPDGRRTTRTDPLRKVVADWARDVETDAERGRWRDPRAGRRLTLAEWREEWLDQRIVAPATLAKNASHWDSYIKPKFGKAPLDTLDRPTVRSWVAEMDRRGVGKHTIEAVIRHLAKMLTDAVEANLIVANPAARLKLPTPDLRTPFFWRREEAAAILAATDDRDRAVLTPAMRTLIDFDLHTGLRIGEIAGMWCEQVDVGAGVVHVNAAQTRYGRQQITKGRSLRSVPIPPHLLDAMRELTDGRPGNAYVWTALRGGPIDDTHFRARVFIPALKAAKVRLGSPHDMRHTAASWLVMAGVDLYRVQALLGHESFRTTQRYAHLAPSAFDAIKAVWNRDASVTHEDREAVGLISVDAI